MSRDKDNFLDRWSRLKRTESVPEIDSEKLQENAENETLESLSDDEILEKLELPDPDSLKEGDDFSAFMSSAVPEHLRRRALKTLWRSNPTLANLDGLLDYGEDYTDAAMVPEVLNTAYKVGRGFLKEILDETEGAPDELMAEETSCEEEHAEAPEEQPIEIAHTTEDTRTPDPRAPSRPRMRFTT